MSNIVYPPEFTRPPVKNPRTRGRPKGTISLNVKRRKRQISVAESPYHPCVTLVPPQKGMYHYPKELLLQKDICCNSYGWMAPRLPADVLSGAYEGFISPLDQLLSQLRNEGHDVSGAEIEVAALREMAALIDETGQKLQDVGATRVENVEWDVEFDGYRS